ncbi:MAG: DNA cytosine methyltransferase, partial [Pseudonocardia sp.]|nr:DNA cytosine methyltransferase [Pseudonocardia sp.]
MGSIDFFAGCGGSGQGVDRAGFTPVLAANHWERAVQSHAANFPGTDHFTGDIHEADPGRFPYAEFFWASPACPKWSNARGVKRNFDRQSSLLDDLPPAEAAQWGPLPTEEEERSRALMWDVPRYLAAMRRRDSARPVLAGVVENVVECRKWAWWDAWIAAIHAEGYRTRLIAFNSMHASAPSTPRPPQSRDRLYLAYWHESLRRDPDWDRWLRPSAWCPTCEEWVAAMQVWKRPGQDMGRYGVRNQYVYRCPAASCRHQIVEPAVAPAAVAIDWTVPGQRIGDRDEPLAPKTMARIEAGLRKYTRPITLEARGHTFERRPGVRTWPADAPLTTLHTTES